MHRTRNALLVLFTFLALLAAGPSARADYIFNEFIGIHRVRDDGTIVRGYGAPAGAPIEEDSQDYAVTPDFKIVYDFTNSLGYSDITYASDVETGQTLPAKYLHSGLNPPNQNFILVARQALIRPNDPFQIGDLFVVSAADLQSLQSNPSKDVIKRYNRTTDSYVETIVPPTSQHIYDFAFGPDNQLYISGETGIYRYSGTPLPPPFPSSFNWQTVISGVNGMITFGPDGRLYVRNLMTGNIDRYTTAGSFVDTFIPDSAIPDDPNIEERAKTIQFGVDGNLHVNIFHPIGGNSWGAIGKYDGTTGNLLSILSLGTLPNPQIPAGRITYLPVPEPSSFVFMLAGVALMTRRSRAC